jgi:TonB family protein
MILFGCLWLPSFAQTEPSPFPASDEPESATARLPKLISRVDPVYPSSYLPQSVETDVYVAFIVDTTGATKKVRAFFSRNEELEKPAEDAVKQWKFSPGLHSGRLVNTQMTVAVHFAPGSR